MKATPIYTIAVFALVLTMLSGCQMSVSAPPASDIATEPNQAAQSSVANPASQYCLDQGGTLAIEERGDGGQFGVCYFEDNRQCEEWALLRGNCPVGGIKVISYVTDAGRCYAITGGALAITGNSGQGDEQGTCTLPNGVLCEVWDYWKGECDAYTVPTEAMAAGLTIQPLPIEVCDGQAQAMSHALDDLIPIQSEEPLYDPFTGASGTGYWRSPARYQAPERLGTSSRSFAGMVNSQPQAVDSSPIPHNSFHSEVKL